MRFLRKNLKEVEKRRTKICKWEFLLVIVEKLRIFVETMYDESK